MERHTTANTAGSSLTLQSGGATSGASNKNGGNLILSSGTATGTGSSSITFKTAAAGSSGTADRAPATAMTIAGNGIIDVTHGMKVLTGDTSVNGLEFTYASGPVNVIQNVTSGGSLALAASPGMQTFKIDYYDNIVVGDTGNLAGANFEIKGDATYPQLRVNGADNSIWDFTAGSSTSSDLTLSRVSGTGDFVISGAKVGIGTSTPQTTMQVAGIISPSANNTYSLGNSTYRFTEVFATNGTINTSDRREKKDILDTNLGLEFINKLRPVSYRWNTGVDNDVHYGLIAQEAEKAISDSLENESNIKTSIIAHDKTTDRYGVRYSELISPLIKSVQEIYLKILGVDREIASVKAENIVKDQEIQKLKQENAAIKSYLCEKDPNAFICKKN